jgi:hypothetical protein
MASKGHFLTQIPHPIEEKIYWCELGQRKYKAETVRYLFRTNN